MGRTEYVDQENIEGSPQRIGDLGADRHAAAGKCEHKGRVGTQRRQALGEESAGFAAISKDVFSRGNTDAGRVAPTGGGAPAQRAGSSNDSSESVIHFHTSRMYSQTHKDQGRKSLLLESRNGSAQRLRRL